jgi:hypothetical protein
MKPPMSGIVVVEVNLDGWRWWLGGVVRALFFISNIITGDKIKLELKNNLL